MFLLYQKKEKVYPESINIDGDLYSINADFRNILRIFDMLGEKNISGYRKIKKLTDWFFEDGLPENIPPEIIIDAFIVFLDTQTPVSDAVADTPFQKGASGHKDEDEEQEKDGRQFCYNFDAKEIYAGFISQYGIDLICVDFLHWYKFKILLDNLSPDSAFKKKIELRFMDLSGNKSTELALAKESVQLPPDITQMQEIKEFNEIWGKAGNN